MQAKVAKLDQNLVELEVEVEAELVEKAMNEAYRRVARRVHIPGFRPGKAPRPVVEKHVGKAPIYEEAVEILFPQAYAQAVTETKIEPIEQPELDLVQLEEGKPFIFKARVEVKPEVKLGEYKGMKATRHRHTVTDEEVEEVLNDLREKYAQLEAVEDRNTVVQGDYIIMDFEGYLDGKPFPGGAAQDALLQVGEGRVIPSFEEQLVGLEKGVEKEITVRFPEDYGVKQLAGQEAVFKVRVKEIKKKVLPELDDEFARTISQQQTLEELKKQIREVLEKEQARLADLEVRNQIIAQVVDNAEVFLPESMVKRRIDRKIRDLAMELAERGMTLEEYLGEERTEEDLRQQFQPEAAREVKTALVLEAIAKEEGLKVTPEELDNRLAKLLNLEDRPDEEKREEITKVKNKLIREGRLEVLADNILIDKVIDLLVSTAEIQTTEDREAAS